MRILTDHISFSPDATAVPAAFSEEVFEVSRKITDAKVAQEVLEKLGPIMRKYRADKDLAIACGMLIEKQRFTSGMRELWNELRNRFPDDLIALRMLMRWYRRDQDIDAGIDHIAALFPDCWRDLGQADKALAGLAELKAWTEIDEVMHSILNLFPDARPIRMNYIKFLNEQSRFLEANRVADKVENRDRMGTASQDLLSGVDQRAETMQTLGLEAATDVIPNIIALADKPRDTATYEKVVFFTGQLGTGGAERQMTRMACAYHERLANGTSTIDPQVWVKHATPESGADFYLPTLLDAGVETRVLADEPDVELQDLTGVSDEVKALMELLAPDVLKHTCALIPMFREQKTDVAYLWQDGGVVLSALAAILAGVPRIVTSFRGLPPNLRPNLARDEQPVLYAALARMPNVTFTANSQKSATAYEEWLNLEPGTVIALPNATPDILADGDESDLALWFDIQNRSAHCTKTVLGVFRYDINKRPKEWIQAAARYCKTCDDTRFVMVGGGALLEDCTRLVADLGLQDRIFIVGIRSNIGFYMHRADLLVHLARMEGLPNVLIEAQLAGTPVLATPAGGTDEVVTNNVTAMLLSDADILPENELDVLLMDLLTDEDELARMGAAAKALSSDRFSVETIISRTTELLRQKPRISE